MYLVVKDELKVLYKNKMCTVFVSLSHIYVIAKKEKED